MEDALVEWLNTFEFDRSCDSIYDIVDGVILVKVMSQISPKYFDAEKMNRNPGKDVKSRMENFDIILDGIVSFQSSVLGLDYDENEFDADVIASEDDDDRSQSLALLRRALGCAVQCAKKNVFVDRIMHMSQASQAQLMLMIDEVMKSQNSFGEEEDDEDDEYSEQDEEEDSKYENILQERDELLARVTELEKIVEDSKHSKDNDAASREKAERAKSRELERLKEAKNALSRREITFQDTIRTLELKLKEANGRLDVQKKQSESSLKRTRIDNRAMADELDVMRTKLANMSKLEAQIVKYKKREESMSEIRDQMAQLETQNQEYLDKMLNMEAEVETIPLLKRQIEEKQSQLVKQSSSVTKFEMELLSRDEELKDLRRKYESSESKLKDALKRASLAESRINELDAAEDSDGDTLTLERREGDPKSRETIARLERRNKVLEKELEGLRSGVSTTTNGKDGGEKESKNQMIELLRKENRTLKSEMSSKLREKLDLQNKLEEIQKTMELSQNNNTSSSSSQNDTAKIETLRNQTIALKERLKEKQRSLEKKSVEQAKLENYVKQALAHANKTVKQSQMKYKNSLRMLKSQIEAKQKEIAYFAGMLEKSKAAHKREKELLMSSIYKIGLDLNSRLLRNEAIGVKSDPLQPKSWLGRRRAERRR